MTTRNMAVLTGLILFCASTVLAGTTTVIVTDSSWTFNGAPVYVHPDRCYNTWISPFGGARWIWIDSGMCSQPCRTDQYFTRAFIIPSEATIVSATLEIAADNRAWVFISNASYNMQQIADVVGFSWSTTIDVTSYIRPGTNTLYVKVQNWFVPGNECGGNSPTGFIARLTIVYNRPPTAQNDSYTTQEDTPLTVSAPGVLGNDSDPDGDTLTVVLVSPPSDGSLTLNPDGSFTYTPPPNWYGTTSFTYKARDSDGAESNVATVTITVTPMDDPPIAYDASFTGYKNQTLEFEGLRFFTYDPDGDPIYPWVEIVSGPTVGSLVQPEPDYFRYTPPQGWTGTTYFLYRVFDMPDFTPSNVATVTIKILNRSPTAQDDIYTAYKNTPLDVPAPGVLSNDSDPDGDPLTAVLVFEDPIGMWALYLGPDGSFMYFPPPGWVGSTWFWYDAVDSDGASSLAVVTIHVVNRAPTAQNDSYTTYKNTPLNVPAPGVLGNDSDPDGDPLTAVLVSPPSQGSLTLNADGSFTYTPPSGWSGTTSFTYKARDSDGAESNVATVTITVNPNGRSAYSL